MHADWAVPRAAWSWAHWEVRPCSPYFPPSPDPAAPPALPTTRPNGPQQMCRITLLHNEYYFKAQVTFTSS